MVLLPLPPFIVATVIICLIRPAFPLNLRYGESLTTNAIGFLAGILPVMLVWPEYWGFRPGLAPGQGRFRRPIVPARTMR